MPQLGETVTEGTITKWFKSVGDPVARDEPLFEVSTDKVDSEVPSPAEGILTEILVEEGDTVDVGVALAVIDGDGAAAAGRRPRCRGRGSPPPTGPPLRRRRLRLRRPAAVARRPRHRRGRPSRRVARRARPVVRPTRPDTAPAAAQGLPPAPPGSGVLSSPGGAPAPDRPRLDPSTIQGTGLGGRITRADVESVIEHGAPRPPSPASARSAGRRPRRRPRRLQPPLRSGPRRRVTGSGPASATKSSPSPTSAGAPPSTWSGPRPRRPTR